MERMNASAMRFGFALAMALLGWAPAAQARIIYDDDFSGAYGTSIRGKSPDVAPGSETWTSSKGRWYANGTKYSTSYDIIYLPFTPESGKLYEVSGSVDATNTLIGVGFNLSFSTTNAPGPWVHVDSDYTAANAIRGYLGAWQKGLCYITGPVDPGYVTVAVQLDTRPEKWTAEFFYNGVSLGSPSAYSTNPTITTVGLLAYTKDGPDANSFQLREIDPTMTLITLR